MRTLTLIAILVLVSTPASRADDDAIEIKLLIPAATAMTKADFKKLATSASPNPNTVTANSLTLEIMKTPVLESDTKAMLEEYSYFGIPKPQELSKEWTRNFSPVVTAVHVDRITKITCDVKNDHASGIVTFAVRNLYAGKFDYTAKRTDGKWKITEIEMPARKIYLKRDDTGNWTKP